VTKPDPTTATYDQFAAQIADRFWETDLTHIWEAFCALLPAGSRILDVGCGSGRDAVQFTERGFNAVGIDLSLGMLLEAARRAPGEYVQADMAALPFCRRSFGAAWMNASLLHLARSAAPVVLAGMQALLKPGGVLYLSLKQGEGEIWEQREGQRFFTFYQVEEVIQLLEQAGFSLLKTWAEPAKAVTWLNSFSIKAGADQP